MRHEEDHVKTPRRREESMEHRGRRVTLLLLCLLPLLSLSCPPHTPPVALHLCAVVHRKRVSPLPPFWPLPRDRYKTVLI